MNGICVGVNAVLPSKNFLSKLCQFLRATADSLVVFPLCMSKTQVLAKSSLKV